jgi:hypothetical protein
MAQDPRLAPYLAKAERNAAAALDPYAVAAWPPIARPVVIDAPAPAAALIHDDASFFDVDQKRAADYFRGLPKVLP